MTWLTSMIFFTYAAMALHFFYESAFRLKLVEDGMSLLGVAIASLIYPFERMIEIAVYVVRFISDIIGRR